MIILFYYFIYFQTDFIDLDYLEGLFTQGGLIDFIKKTNKESFEKKLNQAKEGLNRE